MQAPPTILAPALSSTLAFAMVDRTPDQPLPLLATAFVSGQLTVRTLPEQPTRCTLIAATHPCVQGNGSSSQPSRLACGGILMVSLARQALADRKAATAAALSEAAVQDAYRELVGLALRQLQVRRADRCFAPNAKLPSDQGL